MTIARPRTCRSGNREALRLPKDVAFGTDGELVLVRSGDALTVYPAAMTLPEMAARLRALPGPPAIGERDVAELPERPALQSRRRWAGCSTRTSSPTSLS